MRVLVTAVGHRTEHWTDLFETLETRPGIDLRVAVADISPVTQDWVRRRAPRHTVLPHAWSEARTGHMASVVLRSAGRRALLSQRPDVLHIIGEAAYLSTAQVLRLRQRHWPDVPVTLYAAQNVVMRFPAPFPWLEQRAFRAVDHVLPITPAALQVLRAKGYVGPATIVPLGVDTSRFGPVRPAAGHPFTVGFVGRLEPHKGIANLIEAGRRLDCDLLFVGQGSLAGEVRAEASRRVGRVRLVDWVDHEELPALLAQMDVLALPSVELVQRNVVPWVGIRLREQFGRVLVEAMACGLPVVGSEVGEIPHVVGPAGLTFPAGDTAALADRLDRLRADPDLARRLGRAGLARASTFGWDRIAEQLHGVWQQLRNIHDHVGPVRMAP